MMSATKDHTANKSLSIQFHNKLLWNYRRIDLMAFDHFTAGYSRRTWNQLSSLLKIAGVTMLVDARKNPVSRYKPEFSKSNLQQVCREKGYVYRHVPDLGINSNLRSELSTTHDYDSLFAQYDRQLEPGLLSQLLENELRTERIAFLCVELDPNTCHRHRIANVLEAMGFATLDL